MPDISHTYYSSPVGTLKISATHSFVTEVLFWHKGESIFVEHATVQPLPPLLRQCINELSDYFNGIRRTFDVPVYQEGTLFQKRIWNELQAIPYGKSISYLELSKRIGDVKAIRAVAASMGKNKIAIIVPCHRIIGSDQELVGYGGGLPNKRWLLHHEAKIAHGVQTLF